MDNHIVSIITPCLNSAKTIRQTIESVLHQTYESIEYIIIDGGSEDGTLDIISEYETLFTTGLRYISEKDTGIYDAMNKGIGLATGDVIGIINSDDWYEPDAVERVMECFAKTDADVVYGELWMIDENGERASCTSRSIFPPHPSTFIKREIYQKYGMFDSNYRIASDRELLLRLMAEKVRFERIGEILADHRMTGVSAVNRLVCAGEAYEIDYKYLGKCPDEILNQKDIEETYERAKMLHISHKNPEIIRKVLEKWDISGGIVIFGAGSCGRELESILERCGMQIRFFVDNDSGKWGLERHGIKIFTPEILKHFQGHVVVTVSGYYREIDEQLQDYKNRRLSWSNLESLRQIIFEQSADLLKIN